MVKAWSQLKSAVGWLHPNKPSIHVILLLARKSATSPYRQEVIRGWTHLQHNIPFKFCMFARRMAACPALWPCIGYMPANDSVCCSGLFTTPICVKILSSGLVLWWSVNGGWTATILTVLASAGSYRFCLETVGTPVAVKLSHVAMTNTYVTGYFYRAVIMVKTCQASATTSSALTSIADCSLISASCCCLACQILSAPVASSCRGR